ncbi:hypothetical protein GCM10022222_32530 [Amycolatopsis ultiminotia]|uniref:HTH-type transcriptional repressor Sco4008 C-terminal domain-containing protein n=1 Tax=Amycolatopsis ultiminotia TaxID=543629 RepID=A0ABP6W5R1_9PSEU
MRELARVGSKQQLFAAVLEQEMTTLSAAVPLTGEQAEDLGEFAGRVCDYHRSHPHYLRLLLREGLQTGAGQAMPGPVAAAAERTATLPPWPARSGPEHCATTCAPGTCSTLHVP